MGKFLIIILLVFSGYGAYQHFNKNKGEKIPESKLTPKQKQERQNNKKLALLENVKEESSSSSDVKQKIPPQITQFVLNQMEQWQQLTPGEKNELRHISSRIDQRLPFGNYEKTLVSKLESRNIFEAIRQNNQSLIQNTGNIVHEVKQYDDSILPNNDEVNEEASTPPDPDFAPEQPELDQNQEGDVTTEPPSEETQTDVQTQDQQIPNNDIENQYEEQQEPVDQEVVEQQEPAEEINN